MMRWLIFAAAATAVVLRGPAAGQVKALSERLAKLEASGSPAVAAEAKELHAAADKALATTGSARDAALTDVVQRSKAWLAQLSGRAAELAEQAEVDKLSAQAEHLEPKVSPATRTALVKAVKDGSRQELHQSLQTAVDELKARIAKLSAEHANLTKEVADEQVQQLLRLLRERKTLPLKTQLAVLRRPEFKNCDAAKDLLASAASSETSLYEQLHKRFPEAAEPEADVHHDSGIHSESRRVFVVSSKMKHAVATLRKSLEQVRGDLARAVAEKKGSAEDVREGTEQLHALDALLKKVSKTNDLAKQLQMLDAFEATLLAKAK